MTRLTSPPVPLMSIIFQLGLTPSLPEMMIGIVLCLSVQHCSSELQRRSSKVLEKRSLWSLLKVGNLYQASTTLGLEPVSIVHYTWPGSSIKRPTPNQLATQCHVNWPVVYLQSSYKIMDPVSVACPQNLQRIFVATLELRWGSYVFTRGSLCHYNSCTKNFVCVSHTYIYIGLNQRGTNQMIDCWMRELVRVRFYSDLSWMQAASRRQRLAMNESDEMKASFSIDK